MGRWKRLLSLFLWQHAVTNSTSKQRHLLEQIPPCRVQWFCCLLIPFFLNFKFHKTKQKNLLGENGNTWDRSLGYTPQVHAEAHWELSQRVQMERGHQGSAAGDGHTVQWGREPWRQQLSAFPNTVRGGTCSFPKTMNNKYQLPRSYTLIKIHKTTI